MTHTHSHTFGLTLSEGILVMSGLCILASVVVVSNQQSFFLWRAAKFVYAVGLFGLLVYPGR